MKLIINHSSMQPIYEQIVDAIKLLIMHGELQAEEPLPSVRVLAKELKISALTVKKAYDSLEEDGFVVTVHGKGSFISAANQLLLEEEAKKEVEECFEQAVQKGRSCSMSDSDLRELLDLILGGI